MNKMIFWGLFCFWTLTACRQGSARHKGEGKGSDEKVVPDAGQPISITDLDTSMVSLKTSKAVALSDVVSQLWKFTDADKSHWNEIFWDSVTDTRQYPEWVLFPDHSITADARCGMKIGQWQLNKDTRELILKYQGTSQTYLVRDIALKQLELIGKKEDGAVELRLSADALVHKRPVEDPFYPANNQWRIKPVSSETHDQIRTRIKGCVHFYSLFFLDNHQRQATEISFSGLPSCFIWYNGGIGMQPRTTLDKKWIDCFYSSAEAYVAYDLLSTQLGKHELKWPEHPTSWVKQTGDVLEQLANKF